MRVHTALQNINISESSHNLSESLLSLSWLSVGLSGCSHISARLPIYRFLLNLVLDTFIKIYRPAKLFPCNKRTVSNCAVNVVSVTMPHIVCLVLHVHLSSHYEIFHLIIF